MATENELILRLRTEGVSTVKELKEAIKECRDQLVRLDSTSDDYKETVNELVQYETKLTDVMKAGKREVSAATGSYNALVNEMTSLKRAWKEVTDEAERAKLGRRIGELNAQLKEMDASIGNYQRNVGNYENAFKKALMTPQQELRKLRTELAQLEVGTEAYNRAFTRMTELTTQLRKQQEMLRFSSADLGDILGNLAGVSASVVGGFSAINAAMALMGDESDDIQKAMLQAQRMIQLVQGLSSLQNLEGKIKGLWNGIRNFVTGFQGGAAAVGEFNKEIEKAKGTTEQVTAEMTAEANSINTNAVATNELTTAKRELNAQEMEAITRLDESVAALGRRLGFIREEISMINQRVAAGEKLDVAETNRLRQLKVEEQRVQRMISTSQQRKAAIIGETTAETQLGVAEKKTTGAIAAETKAQVANTGAKTAGTVATRLLTGAVNALNVALKAIGIGILIGLLTALLGLLGKGITSLWKWVSGAKAAEEATNKVNEATKRLNETLETNNENMDFQSRLMEAQGADFHEIYEYKKEQIEANLALAESQLAESIQLEANTKKTWFNKKARKELTEAINEQRESVNGLKRSLVELNQEYEIDKARAANSGSTSNNGGGSYNSQLKEAQNLYKQLQDLYKTDRQKLEETYRENRYIIKTYIKNKKQMNDALLLLERKYYDDLKKLAKENMTQIYNIHLNQEQRRLNLMSTWSDKYLDEQLEVEEKSYKIAVEGAAAKVGFEKKSKEDIALMDKDDKAEYIKRQRLYNNELFLLEKEHERKMSEMIQEQNKRKLDVQRAQLQMNVENAKSEEELLDAQIALAEFEAYTYIPATKEATESQEQHNLRIVQGVKAYEELIEKKKEANKENNDEQLRRDNDATEARIFNGDDSMQYYNKAIEAAQYYYDNLKQLQDESNEQFRQRQLEALDELVDLTAARQEQLRHNWEDLANGIGDIFGSIADMYEEDIRAQKDADGQYSAESKRKFETVKRLQIAQATISTISGAIEAFMGCQSLGQPWGAILGAIQAAAVTAAGVAEIQKIKNTKLGDDSAGGSSTRYAVATPSITDYSPQGVTNVTGGQETEDLANAIAKNPVKAYVVESDVTAAQEVASQRSRESTF